MKTNGFLLVLVFITLISCHNQSDIRILWEYRRPCPVDSIQYEDDKQQFICSCLRRIQTQTWRQIDFPTIPIQDRFFIIVDTILYSQDQNFLFVFYGIGDKGAIASTDIQMYDRPYCYECEAAIGYRDSTNNTYVFYEDRLTHNWENFRDGMDGVEYYYLTDYKNENVIPSWSKYGQIGYNVNDSLFFEKSLLFKRFNDTLYYFQIKHIIKREYANMPDSIILKKCF